jgi:hypothetical protein
VSTLLDFEWNPFRSEILAKLDASVLVLACPHVAQLGAIDIWLWFWLGKCGHQIHITVSAVGKAGTIFSAALRAKHLRNDYTSTQFSARS